jgi:hypothetical protein
MLNEVVTAHLAANFDLAKKTRPLIPPSPAIVCLRRVQVILAAATEDTAMQSVDAALKCVNAFLEKHA